MRVGAARGKALPETVAEGSTENTLEIVAGEGLRVIFVAPAGVAEVAAPLASISPRSKRARFSLSESSS